MTEDVAALLADAPPHVWGRTVLAVAAMHEPYPDGRCRWCRPDRRWWRVRRRPVGDCRTRRVILAELRAGLGVGPCAGPCAGLGVPTGAGVGPARVPV